jgi:hypothetical protein
MIKLVYTQKQGHTLREFEYLSPHFMSYVSLSNNPMTSDRCQEIIKINQALFLPHSA